MAGLANILREKSSIVSGDQGGPQHIQLPDEILLELMGTDEQGVPRFGLGGDVEGGRDEGVGGMSNDGNQSNGTESDYGGGGSWGGPSDYSGGWDGGSISEGMGNWGESNGYGSDFSGPGPGGENMGGSSFGGSSFDNWGDGGFGANISGTNGGFGMGWSGDNIDYEGIADQMGNFGEAAGYGRDFDGPGPGGGNDIYGGYQDSEFGANGFGSLRGMGDAFGAFTADGSLSGPQASNVDFGDPQIGTAPLQGSLDDYAPGGALQTMPSGYTDPEVALTALASDIVPASVDLSFEEEPELVDNIQQPPNVVDMLTDWDLRSPTSLVHPDRRAGFAVATTEQLNNINRGRTLGEPEVGVLAARAASGYGKGRPGWDGIDVDTMYGQAIAPSQFSGINRAGRARDKDLDKVSAWETANPERANAVKAAVEGIIQGDLVPSTMGALSFSTPGTSRKSGNDRSMGVHAGHAFGNYSANARNAYNDRVNPDQVTEDDNPAFNTPARAPGPQSWNAEFNPAEVDLADATPGFTGPVRDSMSLAGLPSNPTERDWGFSDMLGLSAQAKDFNDQVPGLPNQQAYESMPASVDTLAAERAAMGPVNGVPVGKEERSGWGWGDIAGMIGTGLGNLFSFDQPAVAFDEPGPVDRYDQQKGFTPSNRNVSAVLDDALPNIPIQDTDFSLRAGNRGTLPGTASGLVGSGPSFGMRGPAMPGFESMGLPSGRPGSRMSVDPRVDTNRREGPIETDAPPAGALVAGSGVPSMPGGRKSASTGSARPSGGTSAPRGTAVAANEVYGPVMPGMIPGTDRYPTSGVIAQPSTWAHEKIAEPLAGQLVGGLAGTVVPGIGLASMASGLFGGPTFGGLFANSTPGMDLSRGRFDNWDDGGREQERPRTSQVAAKDDKPPKKDDKEPERWTPPEYGDALRLVRTYLGPDADPSTYGRKGRRERQYFDDEVYAAQGGRITRAKRPAEPLQSGLSMLRVKGTA